MTTAAGQLASRLLSLESLVGPMCDKELRVASRRRRTYALRAAYVLLLILYVLSNWYWIARLPSGAFGAYGLSRASVLSAHVAERIIWLQFVATQLVAAVLLGSSMGDEARRGTLSVLLTTPITSVHVVAGKLVGGLLQIAVLPAIGLPALAILRLFGGMSWDLVLSTFCITLTAAFFAGALCLWLSTYYRRSYEAISAGAVVYLIAFALLPLVLAALAGAGVIGPPAVNSIIDLANPFRALRASMPDLWRARAATGPGYFFSWPIHCLIMSSAAALILYAATRRIPRAAAGPAPRRRADSRPVRRLRGSPIVYKDHPRALLQWRRHDIVAGIAGVVLCGLLLLGNALQAGRPAAVAGRARPRPLMIYWYYLLRGLWTLVYIRLAIAAAGGVAREKEGGTWSTLLTTPLDETRILAGKAIVALRRIGPLVFTGLALQTVAVLFGAPESKGLVILLYVLSRLASVFFVLAAGLYFGVRLRSTAIAAAVTLGAFFCLNYLVGGSYNPLIVMLTQRAVAAARGFGSSYVLYLSAMFGGALILDIILGSFLLRRARRNVRRFVF